MYRDSTPPPAPEHDYAIEDAVDVLCARVAAWTRWLDRAGVALGLAAGLSLLWAMRDEGSWGVQRLLYLLVAIGTVALARAARVAIVRALLARWIDARARAHRLDPRELAHRVRAALTVQPR